MNDEVKKNIRIRKNDRQPSYNVNFLSVNRFVSNIIHLGRTGKHKLLNFGKEWNLCFTSANE